MIRIKGKALLIIERMDWGHVPFSVWPFILSCNRPDWKDLVLEEFSLVNTDTHPAPHAAYNLKPGDKAWIKVVYEIEMWTDRDGEGDSILSYRKQTTIRKRPYDPRGDINLPEEIFPQHEHHLKTLQRPKIRKMIRDALRWLDLREKKWDLTAPVNRRDFVTDLLDRVNP